MRLDKFLCDCGAGTRSQVKKYIQKGEVQVNGQVCKKADHKVDAAADQIVFRGEVLEYEAFVYYMFYKPAGCVCAARDNLHRTIFDYVPMNPKGDLFAVGRLDLDTEGLLLVTNDGELSHRLLSPRRHVDKTYLAKVRGCLGSEDVQAFAGGISIGDEKDTLPAQLAVLESGAYSTCEVTIQEGRFHQIKRMFLALGKEVVYLKRLRMGMFVLDPELEPGTYRRLKEQELRYVEEYKSGHL